MAIFQFIPLDGRRELAVESLGDFPRSRMVYPACRGAAPVQLAEPIAKVHTGTYVHNIGGQRVAERSVVHVFGNDVDAMHSGDLVQVGPVVPVIEKDSHCVHPIDGWATAGAGPLTSLTSKVGTPPIRQSAG